MYYLGLDLGSSSLKIALVQQHSGKVVAQVKEPEEEMEILSPQAGWAEQRPEDWWSLCCRGIRRILEENAVDPAQVKGIGVAYQMHGLVVVDKKGHPLREAIIWCDSRAVEHGEEAYKAIGEAYCDTHCLNAPGNFTASKLAWVKENEPEVYAKIHKFMLPGDYVAFRMTGEISTTISGLSEGIFWDFPTHKIADPLVKHMGIDESLFPSLVENFTPQGVINQAAAEATGLAVGTPILYRAGDQPNNALSLNVLEPGEVAATAGTSGVIYAVTDQLKIKDAKRLNHFANVNHQKENQRIGKLLCINGAGIQYNWMRENLAVKNYDEMNALANTVAVGSEGLRVFPFGNGAERIFNNQDIGTRISGLQLNRHDKAHLCRATLEGIAHAFVYGFSLMQKDHVHPRVIRTGNDNMFQSDLFSTTIATLLGINIELYETTGAIGAARAAILAHDKSIDFSTLVGKDYLKTISPETENQPYIDAYNNWEKELKTILNK